MVFEQNRFGHSACALSERIHFQCDTPGQNEAGIYVGYKHGLFAAVNDLIWNDTPFGKLVLPWRGQLLIAGDCVNVDDNIYAWQALKP